MLEPVRTVLNNVCLSLMFFCTFQSETERDVLSLCAFLCIYIHYSNTNVAVFTTSTHAPSILYFSTALYFCLIHDNA